MPHASPRLPGRLSGGARLRGRRSLSLIVSVLLVLAFVACQEATVEPDVDVREREYSGDPRGFMLGFSDIPSELSDEAYLQSYNLAGDYGEVLLIQRVPAWRSFMSDSDVSGTIADQAAAERDAARRRDLALVVALDPFDPTNRARLNMLPDSHSGADLGHEELRRAFVNEATYIAREMRPDYLVLGTDVNVAFERNPDGYRTFVDAYHEAYAAVKAVDEEIRVLVSFQYEELLGVMPDLPPHAPRWELLSDFEGALDLVGITSYPSFAFPQARRLPADYYHDLAEQTDLPLAFLSVGYSSAPGRDGINSSTPDEQRRFLERLIDDAEALGSPMVIWFSSRDLAFAENPPYDIIASMGLQTATGEAKPAWPVWETTSNRPFDPELAALIRAGLSEATPAGTESAEGEETAEGEESPADSEATPDGDSEATPTS